jgi:4-amino-4-deoxy-L-arabinose transferase-like glycosyltransferase
LKSAAGVVTHFLSRKWLYLIILVALTLRLWGITFGLPSLNDPDEPLFVVSSLTLIVGKTLNPGWFGHPGTTTIYALAIIDLLIVTAAMLSGKFANLEEFTTYIYTDPSILFVGGRIFIAVCGIATIILTYAVARRLLNERIGLIAAAILTFMPLHVGFSQIIRTDMQAAMFMLLVILSTLRIARDGRWQDYALTGIIIGCAVATKWPSAMIIVAPIAVGLIKVRERPEVFWTILSYIIMMGAVSIIALFVISPYLLIEYQKVISNLTGEFQSHHVGSTGGSFFENIASYIFGTLRETFGIIGIAISSIGFLLCARIGRLHVAVLILPAVAFFAFICLQTLIWDRWLVPLLPFIALFAAIAIDRLSGAMNSRFGASAARFGIGLLISALVVPMIASTHAQTTERLNDTRNQASDWARANMPSGSKILVEHLAFDLLSPKFSFLFPAGDAGCVEVNTHLNGKIRYSSIGSWRGNRAVVDIGTLPREALPNCRADFAIFTHYDRYVAERHLYDKEARMYESLIKTGKILQTFRPEKAKTGGPIVHIVQLNLREPSR